MNATEKKLFFWGEGGAVGFFFPVLTCNFKHAVPSNGKFRPLSELVAINLT